MAWSRTVGDLGGLAVSRVASIVSIAGISLLLIMLGVVAWQLLFGDQPAEITIQTSDGTANFDAVTAVAYGSRMADIAEVTIVSILTIGGALIGLNWFTSHRNYHDERQRFAEERKAASKELDDAVDQVMSQLDPLRVDISEFQRDQQSKYERLSEAIAAAVFSDYTAAYASIMQPTVTQIRYPLMVLVQSLQALDNLEHTPKVKDVAARALEQFLERYHFVLDTEQEWDLGPFEIYLIGEASQLVGRFFSSSGRYR